MKAGRSSRDWPRTPTALLLLGDQQVSVPQRGAGARLAFENLKGPEKVFRDVQPVSGHGILEDGQDLVVERRTGDGSQF
jgi:hypothetical protein